MKEVGGLFCFLWMFSLGPGTVTKGLKLVCGIKGSSSQRPSSQGSAPDCRNVSFRFMPESYCPTYKHPGASSLMWRGWLIGLVNWGRRELRKWGMGSTEKVRPSWDGWGCHLNREG